MTPIFIKTFKTAISSWFYNCGQALSVILHLVNFYAVLTFCFQVSKTWTNSAFNICIQLLIVYVLIARAAHRSACRSAQSVLAYWFFIDFILFLHWNLGFIGNLGLCLWEWGAWHRLCFSHAPRGASRCSCWKHLAAALTRARPVAWMRLCLTARTNRT